MPCCVAVRPRPTRTGSPGSSSDCCRAPRRRAAPWRLPQVRLGAALAAGLAALLIVLALAGVGPLGGDTPDVRAKDDCPLVRVSRVERVPVVVEGASGDSVDYPDASACSAGSGAAASRPPTGLRRDPTLR